MLFLYTVKVKRILIIGSGKKTHLAPATRDLNETIPDGVGTPAKGGKACMRVVRPSLCILKFLYKVEMSSLDSAMSSVCWEGRKRHLPGKKECGRDTPEGLFSRDYSTPGPSPVLRACSPWGHRQS